MTRVRLTRVRVMRVRLTRMTRVRLRLTRVKMTRVRLVELLNQEHKKDPVNKNQEVRSSNSIMEVL